MCWCADCSAAYKLEQTSDPLQLKTHFKLEELSDLLVEILKMFRDLFDVRSECDYSKVTHKAIFNGCWTHSYES